MRILHTADWHVGRTIRGRSRAEEHSAVLAEIVSIAQADAVDLVLVSGDQFDVAAPSPDAERIVWRTLLDLAETGAQVVAVAGNHDNAARLDAVAPLLASAGVHSGARLARATEGGLLTVESKAGETAQIAVLPFVSQRGIVRADDLMELDADKHAGQYEGRIRAILEHLCAGFRPDTVNLVAAHMMVAGATLGGGERSAHTIFDYAVSSQAFPASAHYVALGHLHRAQVMPGACPIRYSGSPLQLDFGESADQKSVTLVEATPGRPAAARTVALTSGRRLRTLIGSLEDLETQNGTTGEDYLRIVIQGQGRAGMADQVRAWFPEAVDVRVEAPVAERPQVRPSRLGRSPAELFGEYLSDRGAVDADVQALFSELLDAATSDAPA